MVFGNEPVLEAEETPCSVRRLRLGGALRLNEEPKQREDQQDHRSRRNMKR